MVRGRISDWVVRPVIEAARPCPRPEDGTSEDPTAEDCTPEDCTCEGCTAQVCPPEDCTNKVNTSEDRSAEDRTADDPRRPQTAGPFTAVAGRPTSRGILLPCCPLPQRGGRLTGDFGVHSSVFRWKVGDIPGPSSRIRARVSNNQWEVLDDQYFSRFGKWPSGQRDRPETRVAWRTRVRTRGIAAFSAQMV